MALLAGLMDAENLLLSGVTAVTAALVYVSNILYMWAKQCEVDRKRLTEAIAEMQKQYGGVRHSLGKLEGELTVLQRCQVKDCPMNAFRPRPDAQSPS